MPHKTVNAINANIWFVEHGCIDLSTYIFFYFIVVNFKIG